MLRIIGDVHGKMGPYHEVAKGYTSIQVGDMGFGFVKVTMPDNAYFIRGNHDNPEIARVHPNYLGDYGLAGHDGQKFFFVSGAWSIDQKQRIEGVSWWRDEELSIPELSDAIGMYEQYKPDLVITHDCPNIVGQAILDHCGAIGDKFPIPTRTGQALSAMFSIHQPKLWVFGHWHVSFSKRIGETQFRCLAELETLDIP